MVRIGKNTKKQVFEATGTYHEVKAARLLWEEARYAEGYTVSIYQILNRLDVARSWVLKYINPNVRFVQYSKDFIDRMNISMDVSIPTDNSYIYYNMHDLSEWLMDNATFTMQTKIINLFDHTPYNLRLRDYKDVSFRTEKFRRGLIFYSYYNFSRYARYVIDNSPYELACNRKRTFCPDTPIDKFDWWNGLFFSSKQAKTLYDEYIELMKIIWPDEFMYMGSIEEIKHSRFHCKNDEAIYRIVFESACVKIRIGEGKGKVFYTFLPELAYDYKASPEHYLAVLVSTAPDKDAEHIKYLTECVKHGGILTDAEYQERISENQTENICY